ncbi:MAG: acyl-CoA dehydrogenase family protein, partial [Acidimicrobiia bacterium]
MFLAETDEQQALRKELRAYFDRLLTPAVREELGQPGEGSPAYVEIVRQMGADGWLGIGWPEEYGGQGRSAIDQFIFFFEVSRAGAPFPFVTLNTVGPTLMAFGSEAQKKKFLPGILAGEIHFAIGYTEPESGTDLASLRTRAVLDGEEWVINGNKVFTSGANQADYIWLACRTDPDAPKHKGISMIIVPTDTPGFKWTPIVTVGSNTTTATYYDDVRVPKDNLVGDVNAGWRLITNQLNHERVGLAANTAIAFRLWESALDWARETAAGDGSGTKMID